MSYKRISEKQINTRYPNKGIFKEIAENDKDEYLQIYYIYRKLLTEYIIKKIDLKDYEQQMLKSGLHFKANSKKEMDIYQYFSSEELKFFYIRNNTYIEQLSEKEKAFFIERINKNKEELDDEAEKMIEKTYKKVIQEEKHVVGKKVMVFYGPADRRCLADNSNLVIGFRYDKFTETELDDNEWKKQYYQQRIYISKMFAQIYKKIKENLDIETKIIEYNKWNIINKDSNINYFLKI